MSDFSVVTLFVTGIVVNFLVVNFSAKVDEGTWLCVEGLVSKKEHCRRAVNPGCSRTNNLLLIDESMLV